MDYRALVFWLSAMALAGVAVVIGFAGLCLGLPPLYQTEPLMTIALLVGVVLVSPIKRSITDWHLLLGASGIIISFAVIAMWIDFASNGVAPVPPIISIAFFAGFSALVLEMFSYFHLHWGKQVMSITGATA